MAVDRIRRVNELLQRLVSQVLPQVYPNTAHLVTVAGVCTSRDLRNATIHLSVLAENPEEEQAIFREVCELRGIVQQELAAKLTFKSTPMIRFHHDTSAERGVELVNLLDSLRMDDEQLDSLK